MVNSEEEKLLDYSDQPPLLPPKRKGDLEFDTLHCCSIHRSRHQINQAASIWSSYSQWIGAISRILSLFFIQKCWTQIWLRIEIAILQSQMILTFSSTSEYHYWRTGTAASSREKWEETLSVRKAKADLERKYAFSSVLLNAKFKSKCMKQDNWLHAGHFSSAWGKLT